MNLPTMPLLTAADEQHLARKRDTARARGDARAARAALGSEEISLEAIGVSRESVRFAQDRALKRLRAVLAESR